MTVPGSEDQGMDDAVRVTIDNTKQYQCAECGGIFDYGWTEEEAKAEQEANGWIDIPDDFMAVVCDDCYKAQFSPVTD